MSANLRGTKENVEPIDKPASSLKLAARHGIILNEFMRALDPLLFLTGHRGAIERIAATRHAWIVGAILVLSAGIARNYDHLDLLRKAEWFIGPFAASMVSILFIFFWISVPLQLGKAGALGKQLGIFLTLAWMTAPCAWLYGIPVESMTDILTATKWNIAFLAIVSLWRVAIMTRAVAVLTGVKAIRALPLILAPAALEMMVGSFFKSLSLVQIMGGVRLPPHTELLQQASGFAAGASFWVFLVAAVACLVKGRAASAPLYRPAAPQTRSWLVPSAGFAVAALAIWTAIAAPFHPLAANQHQMEKLIREGSLASAVSFASARQREDFLPTHEFPGHRSAIKLLDFTTRETPQWLKQEWTSAAVEDLKNPRSLRLFHNKASLEEMGRRHPEVIAAIHQYAAELRSHEGELDHDERWWLEAYKETFEPEPQK